MQAAAGDAHWEKCFELMKRMVAAVPEKQRKVRPQQPPAGDKAAADAAEKPADAETSAAEKSADAGKDCKPAETETAPESEVGNWMAPD